MDFGRASALDQVSGCALLARAQAADQATLALLLRNGYGLGRHDRYSQYDTVVAPTEVEDVVAAFIVEPDGSVSDVSLISHRTRTAEPQRVILGWKFAPALRSGVPVRMRMTARLSNAP